MDGGEIGRQGRREWKTRGQRRAEKKGEEERRKERKR